MLQLPEGARIHDVFHVGVLKPFHGEAPPTSTPPLPPLQDGRLLPQPDRVLRASLRCGPWHVHVQWAGMPEPVAGFKAAYPSFQLEDELFPEGERDVMVRNVYKRKKKANG